ncbi:MAG: integrase core domain-containing protein [Bacteroidetes bacterium]|nr:integrase core domain-containing protein [Bacteroidota bacterium]
MTYIRVGGGFYYLSLITEVSSRMIVGFDLSHSLGIEGVIRAMKMAFRVIRDTQGMIHHSDRGVQYCSKEYIKLLKSKGIKISMAERGNPYENAIAERVNGILKLEYKLGSRFNSVESAQKAVKEAVKFYNYERPHWSLNLRTPSSVYESSEKN